MKVSVIIPALNEQDTVGQVVQAIREQNFPGVVEILVIDADSQDDTAQVAAQAGARVWNWREVFPQVPVRVGKGESLWRGVAVAQGEIIVFVDADLHQVPDGLVEKLVRPFSDPAVQLVKAKYVRTYLGKPTGGGRVTELTAKPLLRGLFPECAQLDQPLGGEYAIRAQVARHLPFVEGYGVEIGLLIDVVKLFGSAAVVEVDLGSRSHRNRPLEQLAPMADIVAATILKRAGMLPVGSVFERHAVESVGRKLETETERANKKQ